VDCIAEAALKRTLRPERTGGGDGVRDRPCSGEEGRVELVDKEKSELDDVREELFRVVTRRSGWDSSLSPGGG
jgi:hypothetical protein